MRHGYADDTFIALDVNQHVGKWIELEAAGAMIVGRP
jgi:hypothetical protein